MNIRINQSTPVQGKSQENDMSKVAQNKVNGLNRQLQSLGSSDDPITKDKRKALEGQINFIESKMKNIEKEGRALDLYV